MSYSRRVNSRCAEAILKVNSRCAEAAHKEVTAAGGLCSRQEVELTLLVDRRGRTFLAAESRGLDFGGEQQANLYIGKKMNLGSASV